jgi:Tol biopolymer transport system component
MMTYRLNPVLATLFIGQLACAGTPDPLPDPVRFPIAIPTDRTLTTFAVSPDGKWLAYTAESGSDQRRRLFVRAIDASPRDAREVIGATGATNPFFSPDGAWIAYFSRGGIWRSAMDRDSGPQKVSDAPVDAAGGTWTDDEQIVFAPLGGQGLMRVPVSGGTPAALTTLDQREGELEHGWPHALPTGGVVFTVTKRGRDARLEALSTTGERKRQAVLVVGQAQFVSTGHLVYSYLGNLMAVAFDADEMDTRGVPVPIAKGIQTSQGFGNLGRAGLAVSRTGTLAWLRASPDDARSQLVRVDRDGIRSTLSAPPEVYQTPRLSPDGRRLAVVVRPGLITREIRVLDAARPDRVLMVLQGGDNQSPAWMPDNRRLTFGSNRDGLQKIYVVSVEGSRQPRPLFTADVSAARNPASWNRTPPLLAFYEIDPSRRRDVLLYRVGESITPVAATSANERAPALSPDGEWVAYVSDASGRDEIFVKRLNEPADGRQITRTGAVEPVWTREGLFYREGEKLMLAQMKDATLGEPREVFEGHFERDPGANLASYDADSQGRFIMLKSALVPRELRIVTNWGTELMQQAPRR